MYLEGEISKTKFSSALASIYSVDKLVARLKEVPMTGFSTRFELKFLSRIGISEERSIQFTAGITKLSFQIESSDKDFPWFYERKKWYQIFNSTGTLHTNRGDFKVCKYNERFEFNLENQCVATLRFQDGKYRLRFHSKLDLTLCLVASSIFMIENETLIDKTV